MIMDNFREKVGEEGRKGHNSPVGPKETSGLQLQGWGWGQMKRVSRCSLKGCGYRYLCLQEYQRALPQTQGN